MRVDKRGGISLDIYTIYEKDRRIKTGNTGIWNTTYSQKGPAIRTCDYGDYILQKKRRSRRK